MKKLQFDSIKSKITFWLLITAILPLLIVMTIIYNQRVDAISASTFDKLTAIRDLKVEALHMWIDERMSDLESISTDNEFTELDGVIVESYLDLYDNKTANNSKRILNRYLTNYTSYSNLFLVDARSGIVKISTNNNTLGLDKSENSFFTEPMRTEELFIKDIHYSKEINDFLMTFSIPIFSTNKDERHIIAILVAQVDLKNSLYKILLDRTGLGKTGETLIVNKDGLALNELRWYENAPLNLQINAEPVLNAIQGKTGITTTTDYRGEEILVAYTYIAETSWGFVCKQDLSELNAPIRALVNNFVIVFVIVTGLIFLIAFYISNSISNPIVELSRAANKIKGGDYSAQITTTTTNDEIGSLAESTREMAISISSENAIKNGVSDISSAMIGLSSMQEFGEEMLKKMIEITGASMSTFYILNEITSEYEHFASVGANKELLKPFNSQNPEGEFGNAIAKKNIYYMREIPEETIFDFQTTAGNAKPKEIITIPIIVNSGVVALISLVSIYG